MSADTLEDAVGLRFFPARWQPGGKTVANTKGVCSTLFRFECFNRESPLER
jgi:hypothetical protein